MLQRAPQPDARFHADVSKVIARKRDIVADIPTYGGDERRHQFNTLRRHLNAREHVRRVVAALDGSSGGNAQCAVLRGDQINAQIHLEPGEALLFALFQAFAVDLWVVRFGCVRVAADPIAKLTAQHLIDRRIVGFAGQVPERHFDAADAARLPRLAAKLLEFAEQAIHVARVFAQQAAFEHQGVGLAGAIAHFAQAVNALVGIDADDGVGHRSAFNRRDPKIGDLQF